MLQHACLKTKPVQINPNLLLHSRACLPAKVSATLSCSLHHLVYFGIGQPFDLSQALPTTAIVKNQSVAMLQAGSFASPE